MFLARISKGRTIGQFVTGTLTIPFLYIVMWVTMFGNSAIERIRGGKDAIDPDPSLGYVRNFLRMTFGPDYEITDDGGAWWLAEAFAGH